MSDDDIEVITELGDEALELVSSSPDRLVFRIRGMPPGTALGTCNVMFRGDDDVMDKYVEAAYLCIVKGNAMVVASVAKQDPEVDDVRVLVFPDWKNHIPLPITTLAIVIATRRALDPSSVKFGADVVPCNSALKHWRCTLKKTGSKFTFNGTTLQSIDGGHDITTGMAVNVSFDDRILVRSKETWQSICGGTKHHTNVRRIPWK